MLLYILCFGSLFCITSSSTRSCPVSGYIFLIARGLVAVYQSWESRVQLLPPSVDGHTKARMMCRDPTKTCPVFHLGQMNLPVQSDTFEKTQLWVHLEILGFTLLADTIRKAHVQSYFTVTFRFFQIQFGSRAPGKIADLPHFFVLSNLPNGRDSAAIWRMFCRGVE